MTGIAAWLGRAFLSLLVVELAGCGGGPTPPRPKSDAAPLGVDVAAPADRAPDRPGVDVPASEAGSVEAGPDTPPVMCLGPVTGCTASMAGACDHVCQTRCGCQQRCALFSGMPACVPPPPAPVSLGGSCSAALDDCSAGAVCLTEATMACGAHCYRYCRSNADCPGKGVCNFDVEVNGSVVAKACSAPPENCDPAGSATCLGTNRPAPNFGCYVLSALAPDQAVCDCAGSKKLGAPCMYEHECVPGTECIRVGTAPGSCRPVCRLGVAGSCPGGGACSPLGTVAAPSTVFGYCSM